MKQNTTEFTTPDHRIENGLSYQSVKDCLRMLGRTNLIHNQREQEWRTIQDLLEAGIEIHSTVGNRKITSKLIYQAVMQVVNKMKPLDFEIFGIDNAVKGQDGKIIPGSKEVKDSIMTDAISTAMDEGGFAQCLRDKGGAFFKMAIFGDAFVQIGAKKGNGFPVEFRVGSLSDVYIDNGCVDIRDPVSGLSANEVCMIYRYSWGSFCNVYPEYVDKVVKGTIPRSLRWRKQLEKTWIQTFYNDEDVIEVAHSWNLGTKSYVCFAGAACTVLYEEKGENYPFMLNKEPYIPVLHFKYWPSTEGFYNPGIGHFLYDIALLSQEMDNMAFRHASDNIDPINFVAVPQGQESKVFAKIRTANDQRKAGGKGYAVIGYGSGDAAGRSGIGIENFQSPPITEEWERAFTRLEKQIGRLGIQIDSVDRGEQITATQTLSEEENADQNVKQVMEFNASEFKFAVSIVLQMMKELVKKTDKTPIHISHIVEIAGQPVDLSDLTFGAIAEELKKHDYYNRINSRSGAIPSNTMKRAEIQVILPYLAPGSRAQTNSLIRLGSINNQHYTADEFAPPQPQAMPGGDTGASPQIPGENGGQPSETDMLLRQRGTKTESNPLAAV